MIVVDVGCHPQGPEESVLRLIDRFHPTVLLGFDPYPTLVQSCEVIDGTLVVRYRIAAWTRSGVVPYVVDGIVSGVPGRREAASTTRVRCVDLPAILDNLLIGSAPIVLKLDAEGAEYPLLRAIHRAGIDERLERVLVEWHPPSKAHGLYVPPSRRPALRCPVEEW